MRSEVFPPVVPWPPWPPMTVLSPMTETALPLTFTGALITGMIWFPLRIPSSPEVIGATEVFPPVVPWPLCPPMTVLSPMTETALPADGHRGDDRRGDLVSAEDSVLLPR